MKDEFRTIPIDSICPSKNNPRRHVGQAELLQLAGNIRQHGVLSPLLVRPRPSNAIPYEIVFGERRWRAALLAGLAEIPVRIREMEDDQVLELQIIENVQRSDVHPIDEAMGYQALKDKGYTVESMAEKVGKHASYIYQRLKLASLTPKIQKAFLGKAITAGHAILLARLQPEAQHQAFKDCTSRQMVVRDLQRLIDSQYHHDLVKVPWDLEDPELLPAAGSCRDCPKRAGNCPDFDARRNDSCMDAPCYQAKLAIFIRRRMQECAKGQPTFPLSSTQYDDCFRVNLKNPHANKPVPYNRWRRLSKDDKRCDATYNGILADGPNAGQLETVCLNPDKCRVHDRYSEDPKDKQRRKAELQEEKVKAAIELEVVNRIRGEASAPLSRPELEILAKEFYGRLDHDHKRTLCRMLKIEPHKSKHEYGTGIHDYEIPIAERIKSWSLHELTGFLMAVTAWARHWPGGEMTGAMGELLDTYGIEVKEIAQAVRLQMSAKSNGRRK